MTMRKTICEYTDGVRWPKPKCFRQARSDARAWRRMTVWRVSACAGLLALATGGCPPTENVVTDANGQSIRLTAIDRIVTNEDATDEQKRQGLRDLGITDEALIELLVRERSGDT